MINQLTIQYPANLPDALQLTSKEFEKEAIMAMAVKLFQLKKLSSGMAASLVGIDRVSFLLSLHHYGVDMIDFEFDELKDDIANA